MRWNPEPDFDRFTEAVVAMWLDRTPSGYPGDAVAKIACPTLVVRGDDDHLVSRQDAVTLAERVENATLFNLPFAGHAAHQDRADLFASVLNRFLA